MSDEPTEIEAMIRRVIGGDNPSRCWIIDQANTTTNPRLLLMAALIDPGPARMERALTACGSIGDRQVVAIAAAHLRGDHQLVDALARDHLVDHPGSVVVAWMASGAAGSSAA